MYYGDGARPDVLHAAGAHSASAILVCVDDKVAATRIVQSVRAECPQARVLVRAYDREHAVELVKTDGADTVIRETFESAMKIGYEAMLATGATVDEASAVISDLRRLDDERFALEVVGDAFAGRALLQAGLRNRGSRDGGSAEAPVV